MNVVTFLNTYKHESEPFVQAFFNEWRDRAKTAGDIPCHMMQRMFALYPKGKQHRGALTVLGYELGKYQISNIKYQKKINPDHDILKASIMMEMLQTSLLIADDVFDEDDVRRGEPTIHKQWEECGSASYGKNVAFATTLSGFYLAPLVLSQTRFDPTLKQRALDYFFTKAIEVSWGEALDISSPFQRTAQKRQAVQVIHDFKTVNYSGVMPSMLGAILAGSQNQEWLKHLETYGECLGRIFQIQDDIIGSFGDPKETGKANDGDIKQARWTILMELLYQFILPSEKKQIEKIYNQSSLTEREVQMIKDLMVKYQIVEKAKEKAQQYLARGLGLIPQISKDPEYQDTLENLLYFMIDRNH